MSGSIHYENLNISIAFYFFPVMKNSSNESKDTVCEHETSFLNFVPLYHPVYHSFLEYKNCRVHLLGSPEFDTLRKHTFKLYSGGLDGPLESCNKLVIVDFFSGHF